MEAITAASLAGYNLQFRRVLDAAFGYYSTPNSREFCQTDDENLFQVVTDVADILQLYAQQNNGW